MQDGSGWTPLMMAASLKDGGEIVDLLLRRGADVNMTSKHLPLSRPYHADMLSDNNGQTALHFTASKNNLDTARKLLAAKGSTRIKDKRGHLPLHRAAAIGSVPMLKLLLENRSPLDATDIDGLTALHHGIIPTL